MDRTREKQGILFRKDLSHIKKGQKQNPKLQLSPALFSQTPMKTTCIGSLTTSSLV